MSVGRICLTTYAKKTRRVASRVALVRQKCAYPSLGGAQRGGSADREGSEVEKGVKLLRIQSAAELV